jgi:hypothetical protein
MSSQRRLLAVERRCGLFPKKVRPGDRERLAALEQLLTDPAFAAAKAQYAAGLVIGDDDDSRLRAWREIQSRHQAPWDQWRDRHLYCDGPPDPDEPNECAAYDWATTTTPKLGADAPPELVAIVATAIAARARDAALREQQPEPCDCRADAPPAIPDDSPPELLAAEARAIAAARAEMAAYRLTLRQEQENGD